MWQVWQVMRFTLWPQIWMTVSQSHHPSGFTKAYLYSLSNLPWMDPNGYEKTGSNAIQSSRNSRFFCPFFNPSISICHPSPGFFNQHLLKLRQKHWGWQILKVVHGIQGRERCGDFPRLLLSQQNQKGGPFWIFGDNLDGFFWDNLDGYSMVILWLFIIIIHLDGYFWGKNYG